METPEPTGPSISGVTMLGPLPYLHRLVLAVSTLVVGMGIGAWAGVVPVVPVQLLPGVVLGLVAGLAGAFLLVHDFHAAQVHQRTRPARVRRRRLP